MTRRLILFWIGLGIGCLLGLIVYTAVLRKPPTPSESGTQVVEMGKDSQEQGHHQLPSPQVEGAMAESPGDSSHSHSVLENYDISHSTADIVFRVRPDEEQIAAYRQELEENPDSFEALSELGYWLSKSEPEEAIGYLKRVIQIDPKNAEAYRSLARAYDALDQWEGKFAVFDKVDELGIELYPGLSISVPKGWKNPSAATMNGQGDSPLPPDHIKEKRESGFDEPHGEPQSQRPTGSTDAEQQAFE